MPALNLVNFSLIIGTPLQTHKPFIIHLLGNTKISGLQILPI